MRTATRTMALAIDWTDGRVRYVSDETPEPWADILERAGEAVADGAVVTVTKVPGWTDDEGREVYRVHTEWPPKTDGASYIIPIKHTDFYLVGPEGDTRTEADPDDLRDREDDR